MRMPQVAMFENPVELIEVITEGSNTIAITGDINDEASSPEELAEDTRGGGKTHLFEVLAYTAMTQCRNRVVRTNINHGRVEGWDKVHGKTFPRYGAWEMPEGLGYFNDAGRLLFDVVADKRTKKRRYHTTIAGIDEIIAGFISKLRATTHEANFIRTLMEICRKMSMCVVGIANRWTSLPSAFTDYANVRIFRDRTRHEEARRFFDLSDEDEVSDRTIAWVRANIKGIGRIEQPIYIGTCPWTRPEVGQVSFMTEATSKFEVPDWLKSQEGLAEFMAIASDQTTPETMFERLYQYLKPHYDPDPAPVVPVKTAEDVERDQAARQRMVVEFLEERFPPRLIHPDDTEPARGYVKGRILKKLSMVEMQESDRICHGKKQWIEINDRLIEALTGVPRTTFVSWRTRMQHGHASTVSVGVDAPDNG